MYAPKWVEKRRYAATKSCRFLGASRLIRTASHRTNATANAAMPQSTSQMKSGIARNSRKTTVSRLRSRLSSRTTRRIGRSRGTAATPAFCRTSRLGRSRKAAHVAAGVARDPHRVPRAGDREGTGAGRERVDDRRPVRVDPMHDRVLLVGQPDEPVGGGGEVPQRLADAEPPDDAAVGRVDPED